MALTVLEPAATKKLTTVQAAKERLGIPPEDVSQDGLLGALIDAASAQIVSYCGRPFARERYRETARGYGGVTLLLSRTPIVAVHSVLVDGSAVTDYEVLAEHGMLVRQAGWGWSPQPAPGIIAWAPAPNTERENVTVEYTAGYALPGEQGRDLPADVEEACIELVVAAYRARGRDPAITQEKIGDYSASYAGGMPARAVQLLASWRRVV